MLRAQGNRFQMLDAGPVRLRKHGDLPIRLKVLHEQLQTLIGQQKPDVVVIEKVFHGVNVHSALVLGHIRGVVMLIAALHDIPIAEYAPTEVKKAVCGYGRADKAQVQEMVRVLLNLREVPKPNDVADALALAICHAHIAPVLARYQRGS